MHGITNDFIADKPKFAAVVEGIPGLHRRRPWWSSHNAEFDFRFLNAELKRLHRPRSIPRAWSIRWPSPAAATPAPQSAGCAVQALRHRSQPPHQARRLSTPEILAELYFELKCKRQSSLKLQAASAATRVERAGLTAVRKSEIRLVTSAEIERHQSYFDKAWAEGLWAKYSGEARND